MFSEMIQGLLQSSGQANAMKRYTAMNNYVNGVPPKAKADVLKSEGIALPNS